MPDDLHKLWPTLRDIKFAMLTTQDGPYLRSRPMAANQQDFDGTLWFFTHASAHKVAELAQDERVNLSYADPAAKKFVSLSGTAQLDRSRDAIDAHWSEAVAPWFAGGRQDPDIALLRITVDRAEVWDDTQQKMLRA